MAQLNQSLNLKKYLKARVNGDIENPLKPPETIQNVPLKRSEANNRIFDTTTTDDLYDADDSSDGDSRPIFKGFRRIGGIRNGSYRKYRRSKRKLNTEFGGSIKKANKMLKQEPKERFESSFMRSRIRIIWLFRII